MATTTFSEIPYDWLKPGVHIEVRPSYERAGLVAFPARALIIGQRLAGGAGAAGTLYQITRPAQGAGYFGAGSYADRMIRAWWANNKTSELWAIALDDVGAGTAATGTITFTGAGAGTVPLYIDGTRIPVTIAAGNTVTQMAAAAVVAINAETGLPVTAASALGVVTLTAKHKGAAGNQIPIKVAVLNDEAVPSGIGVAVAAMSAGATNPDVTDALDVIAAEWFTDIVVPWDDSANLLALAADLTTRYAAMGKRDGHAYVGAAGTFGELSTKGDVTNSPHISLLGAKGSPSAPWAWAAALGAVGTFQLTNDPARQLRGLSLAGLMAPAPADRFTDTEQNLLLGGGISTFNVLTDGTVTIDRVVTTYKESSLGVADRAWLDIMVPKTMTRLRYDWASYITLLYPRHKLADDDTLAAEASDAVVTPRTMLGTWAARCKLYERQAWIEASSETIEASSFWRSTSDRNRLEGRQAVRIIGNLMVLAAALEFQV